MERVAGIKKTKRRRRMGRRRQGLLLGVGGGGEGGRRKGPIAILDLLYKVGCDMELEFEFLFEYSINRSLRLLRGPTSCWRPFVLPAV